MQCHPRRAVDGATHSATLSKSEISLMAKTLNVKPEEVVEMEMRLSGGDVRRQRRADSPD